MNESLFGAHEKEIAGYAKALSHPIRVYILTKLAQQSCCYSGELHTEIGIAKSTLSQHLSELKKAQLIQGFIQAPKVKYCIHQENWSKAKQLFAGFFNQEVVQLECNS